MFLMMYWRNYIFNAVHLLGSEKTGNELLDEVISDLKFSVDLRYAVELLEWEVCTYGQWKEDERFIKMLLVVNFISPEEMERYFNCFKDDIAAFFKRCSDLQDYRIVETFWKFIEHG